MNYEMIIPRPNSTTKQFFPTLKIRLGAPPTTRMSASIHAGDLGRCERLHQALSQCHRRVPKGPAQEAACRHLNRSLAECLVAEACPTESEAVRSLCSSSGTAMKRSQCQQAQLSLSVCLSSLQTPS